MPRSRLYTDEQFFEAVRSSVSIAETLRKIGIVPCGGNYCLANLRIKKMNIDTSHFVGQGHLKGKTHGWSKKIDLKDILVEDSKYSNTVTLKRRLIKEGLLENKCYECGITEWRGTPISLELEHINGNRFDNRIANLCILCPNCHSQTKTFRGRNIKRRIRRQKLFCKMCNKELSQKRLTMLCLDCCTSNKKNKHSAVIAVTDNIWRRTPRPNKRKVVRPSKEELEILIANNSYLALAKMFGVTDNAVRKWAKQYGIAEEIIRKQTKKVA